MKFKLEILGIFLFISIGTRAQKRTSETLLSAKVVDTKGDTLMLRDTLEADSQNFILVDYWASWCGPCVAEMPKSKKLQKQFQGKALIFLYLSVDKSDQAWIRGLNKIQIKGLHFRLLAASKPAIQQAYKIKGIPFYQILGKNRVLIKNNTFWPSDPKLAKTIKKILE